MKKVLAVLLAALLLVTALPMGAVPVFADQRGVTGTCTWRVESMTLTISGTGSMRQCFVGATAPWISVSTPVI